MDRETVNNKPKISIIVPVYGVEKYLDRCITSIERQTFSNIEVILIDDESPDRSGIMCDNYKSKYDNITVIHQKNGGQANARNIPDNSVVAGIPARRIGSVDDFVKIFLEGERYPDELKPRKGVVPDELAMHLWERFDKEHQKH